MNEAALETSQLVWSDGDARLAGEVVQPKSAAPGLRAGVLVFPTFKGVDDFARAEASFLAGLGYVALTADMYGGGEPVVGDAAAGRLMDGLVRDRPRLRHRAQAALEALAGVPGVDPERMAAIGFCFGGLCVLELARSGADVKGVVSFHGFFHTPEPTDARRIRGRVLAHHGNEDPLLGPGEVEAFREEMASAGVDFTLVVHGGAKHGFMNPAANAPERGVLFHPQAARRARASLEGFLREVLEAPDDAA